VTNRYLLFLIITNILADCKPNFRNVFFTFLF